jgi:hypothetical protein
MLSEAACSLAALGAGLNEGKESLLHVRNEEILRFVQNDKVRKLDLRRPANFTQEVQDTRWAPCTSVSSSIGLGYQPSPRISSAVMPRKSIAERTGS